jgi:CheY-like chemotaxis protein
VAGQSTLLLVEDEPSILRLSGRLLQSWGYNVLSAAAPKEALLLAERHQGQIDLLLTDVILPEMNGRQLFEALQKLRPTLKCVYMSGYTADVIGQHGVLDSGLRFLQKPFTSVELAKTLRAELASGQDPVNRAV